MELPSGYFFVYNQIVMYLNFEKLVKTNVLSENI